MDFDIEYVELQREVFNAKAMVTFWRKRLKEEAVAGIPREQSSVEKATQAATRWLDARRALWGFIEAKKLNGILSRDATMAAYDNE